MWWLKIKFQKWTISCTPSHHGKGVKTYRRAVCFLIVVQCNSLGTLKSSHEAKGYPSKFKTTHCYTNTMYITLFGCGYVVTMLSCAYCWGVYTPIHCWVVYTPIRCWGEYTPIRCWGEYTPIRCWGEYTRIRCWGVYTPISGITWVSRTWIRTLWLKYYVNN